MSAPAWGRRQTWTLVALLAVAAALRFWRLTDLGLTHFDEGSYAMTGRWLATFGREGWIYQSGHAPGLFPTLVGVFFLLFGVHDYVAIAVSALAGSLTVGLIYAVGREWLDEVTGVLAALFLATAEYHLIYSRLALTDAWFTLLFWAALWAYFRAARTREPRWFVLAGVLTGLCWNTKYHGFFPWLVALVWFGAGVLLRRAWRAEMGALWRGLVRAGLAAALVYLPWFLFVQISVGYGVLLQHQLGHSLTAAELISTPPRVLGFYLKSWLSPALLLFAGVGTLRTVLRPRAGPGLVLTATALVLAAASLYLSFPRLILPAVPGVALLAAYGVTWTARVRPGRVGMATAMLLGAAVLAWNFAQARPTLALATDGYRRTAAYLQSLPGTVITQMSKNYYFYENEPSYEIRRQDTGYLDSLLESDGPVWVAVDPIVRRFPEHWRWFERRRSALHPVRTFELRLYEPLFYQGIDPTLPAQAVPLEDAPFRPGEARVEVFRIRLQSGSG